LLADRLVLVDLSARCIDACRRRAERSKNARRLAQGEGIGLFS